MLEKHRLHLAADMRRQPFQPAEDAHGFDIQLRPFAPPLRQDPVYVIFVGFAHAASISADLLTSRYHRRLGCARAVRCAAAASAADSVCSVAERAGGTEQQRRVVPASVRPIVAPIAKPLATGYGPAMRPIHAIGWHRIRLVFGLAYFIAIGYMLVTDGGPTGRKALSYIVVGGLAITCLGRGWGRLGRVRGWVRGRARGPSGQCHPLPRPGRGEPPRAARRRR